MATTIATISISSTDLLSSNLAFTSANPLNKAGLDTGVTSTTGLARTATSYASSGVIDTTVLYRADDYTADKANKIYLKNLSTDATEYYTIYMTGDRAKSTDTDATALIELGRLYSGDWAFFPWNATGGTKETFTCVVGNTWAAGDTVVFDGVTIVAANSTVADIATQIDAAQFPNWITSVSSATVTFVSRQSRADIEIDTSEIVATTAGDGDLTISTTAEGTRSLSDIYIKPSVHTSMTIEHMLFHE
jgi:hypothetical protein